jgi:hypothetical protein
VAESYRVPDAPNWIADLDVSTAVTWTPTLGASGALLDRGSGYIAIEWAGIAVVAVYVSPNSGLAAFGNFLDEVGECVKRCFPRQVLVLVDFNAHSTQWGELRDEHQRKMADRLGRGTRTPAGEQGEHLRGVEGVLRGRRHVGHLGAVPEDPRLESGRLSTINTYASMRLQTFPYSCFF